MRHQPSHQSYGLTGRRLALLAGDFQVKAVKVIFAGTWFFYSEWAALARQEMIGTTKQRRNQVVRLCCLVSWLFKKHQAGMRRFKSDFHHRQASCAVPELWPERGCTHKPSGNSQSKPSAIGLNVISRVFICLRSCGWNGKTRGFDRFWPVFEIK